MKPTIASYLEHTMLQPNATENDIRRLCRETKKNRFGAVCVNPCWVQLAAASLRDTNVKICTVVGYPLGASTTVVKSIEAKHAVNHGAQEIDMVPNVGYLKVGNEGAFARDIAGVRRELPQFVVLKVILDTSLLTEDEIALACQIIRASGANYVVLTTNVLFAHVKLVKDTVGQDLGIKVVSNIENYDTTKAFLNTGVERIGSSASVAIVTEAKSAGASQARKEG